MNRPGTGRRGEDPDRASRGEVGPTSLCGREASGTLRTSEVGVWRTVDSKAGREACHQQSK